MMNNVAKTYLEYKSGEFEQVAGLGRLGCYQGLDYFEKYIENEENYSEALEDCYVFIRAWINYLEKESQDLQQRIDKAIEYINHFSKESEVKIYGLPDCKVFIGDTEQLLEILGGKE